MNNLLSFASPAHRPVDSASHLLHSPANNLLEIGISHSKRAPAPVHFNPTEFKQALLRHVHMHQAPATGGFSQQNLLHVMLPFAKAMLGPNHAPNAQAYGTTSNAIQNILNATEDIAKMARQVLQPFLGLAGIHDALQGIRYQLRLQLFSALLKPPELKPNESPNVLHNQTWLQQLSAFKKSAPFPGLHTIVQVVCAQYLLSGVAAHLAGLPRTGASTSSNDYERIAKNLQNLCRLALLSEYPSTQDMQRLRHALHQAQLNWDGVFHKTNPAQMKKSDVVANLLQAHQPSKHKSAHHVHPSSLALKAFTGLVCHPIEWTNVSALLNDADPISMPNIAETLNEYIVNTIKTQSMPQFLTWMGNNADPCYEGIVEHLMAYGAGTGAKRSLPPPQWDRTQTTAQNLDLHMLWFELKCQATFETEHNIHNVQQCTTLSQMVSGSLAFARFKAKQQQAFAAHFKALPVALSDADVQALFERYIRS